MESKTGLSETPWGGDPILKEVYAIRDAISAECDDDMAKIFEALKRTAKSSTLKKAGCASDSDPSN